MASRGYIFLSVDENFLNFSFADFINPISPSIGRENDARGWMLLEHLKLFRQWNNDPDSRFNGKVDMKNIALMGHSRGGEAVAVAAAFNPLMHYPDDAIPVTDFLEQNVELDADSLASMSFVFDQGERGALWLNDVGFNLQ
jgi:hypothetical protein